MTKFHPLCCRNLHLSYADSGPLLTTTFKFVVYVALKVTKTIRVACLTRCCRTNLMDIWNSSQLFHLLQIRSTFHHNLCKL